MSSQVMQAAQVIAEILEPLPVQPSARWRWGTVESVNQDGTLNVVVAGTQITVKATTAASSASAGQRVRISYLGTDAIADGVLATSSGGGGGGGTDNYNDLSNKPSIESHVLTGNSTLPQINVNTMTNAEIDYIMSLVDA